MTFDYFRKKSLPERDEDFKILKTKKMMTALKAIPQQAFQKCFQQWRHHWAKCVPAQWEYIEGSPQLAVSIQVRFQ
jgi:hypothetical protein